MAGTGARRPRPLDHRQDRAPNVLWSPWRLRRTARVGLAKATLLARRFSADVQGDVHLRDGSRRCCGTERRLDGDAPTSGGRLVVGDLLPARQAAVGGRGARRPALDDPGHTDAAVVPDEGSADVEDRGAALDVVTGDGAARCLRGRWR